MKYSREDYVAKVSNATPLGLIIINYELIIDYAEDACSAHQQADMDGFLKNLNQSREFLILLMKSLDMEYEISKELLAVYLRISSLLVKGYYSKNTEHVREAIKQLNIMLDSWTTLQEDEDASPVMENAQQLYAGLTYKNGRLSEYIPEDNNRGFRA